MASDRFNIRLTSPHHEGRGLLLHKCDVEEQFVHHGARWLVLFAKRNPKAMASCLALLEPAYLRPAVLVVAVTRVSVSWVPISSSSLKASS